MIQWQLQFDGESVLIIKTHLATTPRDGGWHQVLRIPLDAMTRFSQEMDRMLDSIASSDGAEGPIDREWTTED